MLRTMKELPMQERVRRLVDAGRRDSGTPPDGDRGELLKRLCLGCQQVLDSRPDGDAVRYRQEPPAADYREIWARLNKQWRQRND